VSPADYVPILPQIVVLVGAMSLVLLEPFTSEERKSRMAQIAVVTAAVAAFVLTYSSAGPRRTAFNGMFVADGFSYFFQWLFLLIAATSALVSMRFNERERIDRGEYYSLLLLASSGMSLMAASGDLILTFLGLEILSIATYVLAGFKRSDAKGNEAALKYFLLGSFASAFFLYGVALIYGSTGSTNYASIRAATAVLGEASPTLRAGLMLLLVGFGFKVAVVPFHAWAPDVYEGAPTPVTAFMTVGPKAAGFAALVRVLLEALPALEHDWSRILWVSSLLTMVLGNTVALLQTNVKRLLAYSSIAHAGYILVGIVAHNRTGIQGVLFYLLVYTIMNLGAFSIVLGLSRRGDLRVSLDDYAGLGRRNPVAAAILSVCLLSLAGIPPTAGFMGKLYLFGAALQDGYTGLAVVGVLTSVVSVFYYFRLMVAMYMRDPVSTDSEADEVGMPVMAIALISALAILWLGVFPARFLNLASYSSLALK
jgi:NADH-quinone oxidoreductase subunit N